MVFLLFQYRNRQGPLYTVLGMEPWASCMLGKHSINGAASMASTKILYEAYVHPLMTVINLGGMICVMK